MASASIWSKSSGSSLDLARTPRRQGCRRAPRRAGACGAVALIRSRTKSPDDRGKAGAAFRGLALEEQVLILLEGDLSAGHAGHSSTCLGSCHLQPWAHLAPAAMTTTTLHHMVRTVCGARSGRASAMRRRPRNKSPATPRRLSGVPNRMEGCHERLETDRESVAPFSAVAGLMLGIVMGCTSPDPSTTTTTVGSDPVDGYVALVPRHAPGGGDRLLLVHAVQRPQAGQQRRHGVGHEQGQEDVLASGPGGHRRQGHAGPGSAPGAGRRVRGQGDRQRVLRDHRRARSSRARSSSWRATSPSTSPARRCTCGWWRSTPS